jgi:hypothetical protein
MLDSLREDGKFDLFVIISHHCDQPFLDVVTEAECGVCTIPCI